MNCLVSVEGPRGVGKTPLVERLKDIGFQEPPWLFHPKEMIEKYSEELRDAIPGTAGNAGIEALIYSNCFFMKDIRLIFDKGFLSSIFYDPRLFRFIRHWINLLGKWDNAIVICLDNNAKNPEKGENDESFRKFRRLYKAVPEDLRLYYTIENYESDWLENLIKRIRIRIK